MDAATATASHKRLSNRYGDEAMSLHIKASVFWGGNVFFLTDTDEVYRVWIGGDYYPIMERLANDPMGDYSWPIQELRKMTTAPLESQQ